MTIQVGPLQPTYITLDPVTGKVGADFSGKVAATELDLTAGPAGSGSPINWYDSLKNLVGRIFNWAAAVPGPNQDRQLILQSIADAANGDTMASVKIDLTPPGGVGQEYNVIDSLGGSSFLQAVNDLSDIPNLATALANLGGLAKAANLSDLASIVTARKNLGLSWGMIQSGSLSKIDAGSGDWSTVGTATGATQINGAGTGNTYCFTAVWYSGTRDSAGHTVTVQAAKGTAPVITTWVNGVLTSGIQVGFITLHD